MQGFILIGASVPVEHPQKAMEVHFGSHRPFDDDYDPDDDDVPFGYGGSAAVSHIQDECMAHEEDMLAFERRLRIGRPGRGRRAPWRASCTEPCRLRAAHPSCV